MRIRVHYLVALVVACVIVAAGAVFVRQTWAELRSNVKQAAAHDKAARTGGQPLTEAKQAELDAQFERGQLGMMVSPGMHRRLDLAILFQELWYVLVPLVFAGCLGAAAVFGRLRGPRR